MASKYPASPGSASSCGPGSPTLPSRTFSPASPPPSTRTLDDLLICPICLDSYKDPKTLTCLHSFCSRCLENCRRPYRRDISCPVCKKITPLSPMGITGLQNDFRIQQIRDILLNRPNSPGASFEDNPGQCSPTSTECRTCDLCKTQSRITSASCHCIQCYMYFCGNCTEKHNANPLFSSHSLISLSENKASDTLFCKTHRDHPVRYFCKPCSLMMCTICTMDHDTEHAAEPLERGIIERYRVELQDSLRAVRSRLSEAKTCSKYLETVKQSHQRALYHAQKSIKDKTEDIITKMREQEQTLLQEVQQQFDDKLKEYGVVSLGEVNFKKTSIEALYGDIQRVIQGSPQDCLVAYEDLISRMKAIDETSLPQLGKGKLRSTLKFVPAKQNDLNLIIGSLHECQLSSDEASDEDASSASLPQSASQAMSFQQSPNPTKPQIGSSRRMSSILNAISPGRKGDVKIGKVKAFSTSGLERSPSSPTLTINADELLLSQAASPEQLESVPSPGSSMITLAPSSPQGSSLSPTSSTDDLHPSPLPYKTKLLFKVDQIGGWPGRITSPCGSAFLPEGNIVVAECENRLQIFNMAGNSIRIIGWGKIKPQGLAVTQDGKIVITDKKDRCVKTFQQSGDMSSVWGAATFGMPSGIAVFTNGNFVVTDVDCNTVSLHDPNGILITKFGSWGSGDYQFNHPTHVTVDSNDNIIVSDSGNSCIKTFDRNGVFIRKFSLQSGKQGQLRRPQGLAADHQGSILIADRDNHRISMFSPEGRFQRHILTKQDGIRYPVDVVLQGDSHIAVVETHSGFLTKDPHHAIKLYQIL